MGWEKARANLTCIQVCSRPGISLGYLILFIVVGVILVTISIEVLASGIIHQVHFMGRQMGRARVLAGKVGVIQMVSVILKIPFTKVVQTLNRVSMERVIGLGLVQMNIFARLGAMAAGGVGGALGGDPESEAYCRRQSRVLRLIENMMRDEGEEGSMGGGRSRKTSRVTNKRSTAYEPKDIHLDFVDVDH